MREFLRLLWRVCRWVTLGWWLLTCNGTWFGVMVSLYYESGFSIENYFIALAISAMWGTMIFIGLSYIAIPIVTLLVAGTIQLVRFGRSRLAQRHEPRE